MVPPGTVIKDDNKNVLCDLNKSGESFVAAKGGSGGNLKTPDYTPRKGTKAMVTLELKLIADVGLVGYVCSFISHVPPPPPPPRNFSHLTFVWSVSFCDGY